MNEAGLVWDNHACLPLRDVDAFLPSLSRYRDAGVDVVTVNIGDSLVPLDTMIRTAASIRHFVKGNPDKYLLGLAPSDLRAARASGRLAVCLDVEGVQALGPQLSLVEFLYEIGVRWMLLVYNRRNLAGSGCHDPEDEGPHRARARNPARNGSSRHGQVLLAHRLSHGARNPRLDRPAGDFLALESASPARPPPEHTGRTYQGLRRDRRRRRDQRRRPFSRHWPADRRGDRPQYRLRRAARRCRARGRRPRLHVQEFRARRARTRRTGDLAQGMGLWPRYRIRAARGDSGDHGGSRASRLSGRKHPRDSWGKPVRVADAVWK